MAEFLFRRPFVGRLQGCSVIFFLSLVTMDTGCQNQLLRSQPKDNGSAVLDPIALRSDLRIQMDESLAQVISTAADIADDYPDRRIRESALRWKTRFFDSYLVILTEEDPRAMFLLEWTAMVYLRQYVTQGAGKEGLGPAQPVAAALAEKLEQDILAVGYRYYPVEVINSARDEIEADAQRYSWETPPASPAISAKSPQSSDLLQIMKLPLLPLTTMERVSDTPAAINRFTDTASNFSLIIQHLPERMRWQMELLSLEMESTGPVAAMITQVDQLDHSLKNTMELLKALPAQIRGEWETGLAATEKLQPEFRATLTEARTVAETSLTALETAQQAIAQAGDAAQRLTETAQAFEKAAAEIRILLADFSQMRQSTDTGNDKKEAGVEEYRQAADSIAHAAGEIRAVLTHLQQPFPDRTIVNQTAGEVRGLINYIFWRAVLLSVIIFLLAIRNRNKII